MWLDSLCVCGLYALLNDWLLWLNTASTGPKPDVKMWRESVSCVQVLHCVCDCVCDVSVSMSVSFVLIVCKCLIGCVLV